MSRMLVISADKVRDVLTYRDLIASIRSVLGEYSNKVSPSACQPIRINMPVEPHHGRLFTMPGYSGQQNALACKIVALYPNNADKGLSTHLAQVLLFDSSTGALQAIVDGETITAMRTAAASAVASQLLCCNPDNPQTVAIIGTGVQARSHAQALREAFLVKKIIIWGRNKANSEKCASEIGAEVALTPQDAVRDADIICTVTMSNTPVLWKSWVKPGSHINCVGAPIPTAQELDPSLVVSSDVYADSMESAYAESGDIILSKAQVIGEIGDLVNGTKKAKRERTTIFKSLGIGLEDAVCAKLIYDKLKMQPSKL